MAENNSGFSSLAKGLFIGTLLGGTVAVLYASRRGIGLRGNISKEGVHLSAQDHPVPPTTSETIIQTGNRIGPAVGWSVAFILASAVAMVSNFKMKNY